MSTSSFGGPVGGRPGRRSLRGRAPWGLLGVLFVIVPLVEIYLVVRAGQTFGIGWTLLVLVADSVLGAVLLRREGAAAWRALRDALGSYRMPARELADGMLVLVGGTLLLTPGFLTDALGFFLILPFTRPLARRGLTAVLARRFLAPTASRLHPFGGLGAPGRPGAPGGAQGWGTQAGRAQPGRAQPGPAQPGGAQNGQRPGGDRVVRGDVVEE